MNCLTVLAGLTALCAVNAIPLVPEDNSHYVDGVSRYIWMTDDNGVARLEDLEAPVDFEFLEENNGTGNQYWLFTRSNPTTGQLLVNGDEASVRNSNYDGNKELKVIIHGFGGSLESRVNTGVTSAFLEKFDVNVIVVDWRDLAGANYVVATAGVPIVGRNIYNFLRWLISTAGGDWNRIHLVGHSLGAHAAGVVGRVARRRLIRPARITGLDPANPLWNENIYALSGGNGQYVEVIHTDILVLGIAPAIGDADFYPNGGRNQPGCDSNRCSHSRSHELFASSIRTDHFVGKRCLTIAHAFANSCNGRELNMGNGIISKRGRGIYGLRTQATWPF